jgi:hypothetical protein
VVLVIYFENVLVVIQNSDIDITAQYTKIRNRRLARELSRKKGGASPINVLTNLTNLLIFDLRHLLQAISHDIPKEPPSLPDSSTKTVS